MKYTFYTFFKGEEDGKYKVVIKDKDDYRYTYKVKNYSVGLMPEFYGKEFCKIEDTGDKLKVKFPNGKAFDLDYGEAIDLLIGLKAHTKHDNVSVEEK